MKQCMINKKQFQNVGRIMTEFPAQFKSVYPNAIEVEIGLALGCYLYEQGYKEGRGCHEDIDIL